MIGRCVLKIGGSLLRSPHAPGRIASFCQDTLVGCQINLVVGGGAMIDALRELDRVHRFDPVEMHWRCVRALRLTFELAVEWFPDAHPIATREAFVTHLDCALGGCYLIAPDVFYGRDDDARLPCDWRTTSDSIAALLAQKLSINRLVLIKSCEVSPAFTIADAAAAGIVDAAFVEASRGLDVTLHSMLERVNP